MCSNVMFVWCKLHLDIYFCYRFMGQFYRILLTLLFTAIITLFVVDFQMLVDGFEGFTEAINQLFGRRG